MSKPSAEASKIIDQIKGKGKASEAAEKTSEEETGDASTEGARAACESMLKVVFRGREPSEDEAAEFEDALDAYLTAKGY